MIESDPIFPVDVALLTDHRYEASIADESDWYLRNILDDDRLLQKALESKGLSSFRVDWARTDVDWSQFGCAVFRTTWDYYQRPIEFSHWLSQTSHQTRFCNQLSTVLWNMDKHYLKDIEKKGIPVVPCRFLERGSSMTLHDVMDETGWVEAIIKPCISGAARHTYRVNRESVASISPVVSNLLTCESLIFQPFEKEILSQGEDTLMLFGGRFTHAVRKKAKAGDFRVQDDHGGTVHPYTPSPEQIDLAERAIAVCNPPPAYGRVDMVNDNQGQLAIMELELIEPELWLRNFPSSAIAFANVIATTFDD